MKTISDALFCVDKVDHAGNIIKADLSINPDSSIFKGHFPGQPVVPGACMLQIMKEVLESALSSPVQLKKAANIKFTGMIDPLVTTAVQMELVYTPREGLINVTGKLTDGDRVCFKLNGMFGK
jgi:3-hydroxyacyl-[acyl-carrier-protein] dehydratase